MRFLPKRTVSFDPNYSNKEGQSYLHFFAHNGEAAWISLYASAGADLNKRDRHGMTPLHYASLTGQREAVLVLLKLGADAGIKNNNGNKPADIARKCNHHDIAVLIEPNP